MEVKSVALSISRFLYAFLEAGLYIFLIYFVLPKKHRMPLKNLGLYYIWTVVITFLFLHNGFIMTLIWSGGLIIGLIFVGKMPVYVASISIVITYVINLIGSLIAIIFAVYFYTEKIDYRFIIEDQSLDVLLIKFFIVGSCLYIYKIFNALFSRKTKIQKINPRPVVFVNFAYLIFIIFLSLELIDYIPRVYSDVLKIEDLKQLLFTGVFMAYIASIFVLYIINVYLFKSSDYLSIKLSSETDALTGVLNRKAGISFLKEGMQQVQNKKNHLTLCFIDVDNLKTVNDNHGHKLGDELICETARIVSSALREEDEIARLGGDEFLVIFNNCNLEQGIRAWERILEKFETFNVTMNKCYDISLSVGFCEYNHHMTCSYEDLIEKADQEMYKNKARNKRMKGSRNGKW